jgi:hypothetical protein
MKDDMISRTTHMISRTTHERRHKQRAERKMRCLLQNIDMISRTTHERRHTPNLLDRKILILIRGVTHTNQRIDHVTSREREARAAEPLSDDGVQPRRHLQPHVVGPVPGLPFPEVCRVRERRDGSSAHPVHLEAPHRLEPAQPHDVRRPRRSPQLRRTAARRTT